MRDISKNSKRHNYISFKDWSFKLSNERIREITKSTEIKSFCAKQHLEYIAHVTRLENDSLQKQFLFSKTSRSGSSRWKKFSDLTALDESQLRRIMLNRKEFFCNCYLKYFNILSCGST